jgi:hypothetical protein
VKEANRKVLGIALTVFISAMMVAPVMATAPEKNLLTWNTGPNTFTPIETRMTGKIQHGKYTNDYSMFIISWSTIATPPMMAPIQDPDNCLLGDGATITADYSVNRDTMKGVIHFKMVVTLGEPVTFGPVTLEPDEGTFEGNMLANGELHWVDPEDETMLWLEEGTWKGEWRGTGAYQGWKVVINQAIVDGTPVYENYIFRR